MIGIVGQGAIGTLLLHDMILSNINAQVIQRNFSQAIPKVDQVEDIQGNKHRFCANIATVNNVNAMRLIIVPVKVFQVIDALTMLKPYLSTSTSLLLLHNGLGVLESAQRLLPNNIIFSGICTMGAYMLNESTVKQAAIGDIDIGNIPSSVAPNNIANLANLQGIRVNWHTNIVPLQLMKLAINAIINPITAIYNINNGKLQEERYRSLIQKVLTEITLIYDKMGHSELNSQLASVVQTVIVNTANNFSSMYQDVQYGRQTEVDAILGYLIKQGNYYKLPCQQLKTLYKQVSLR